MAYKNKEGYPDPTAGAAVRAADKPPEAIGWLAKTFRDLASLLGFEIVGRITFKDRNTGREWR